MHSTHVFVTTRAGLTPTHAYHARTGQIGRPGAFGDDCTLPLTNLLSRPGVDCEITRDENFANALWILLQREVERDDIDGDFERLLVDFQTDLLDHLHNGGLYEGHRLQIGPATGNLAERYKAAGYNPDGTRIEPDWPTEADRLRPLREELPDSHADEIADALAGHP